jgi:excisionase family DNA binding protein
MRLNLTFLQTIAEAAEALDVSRQTLHERARAGKLTERQVAFRLGGAWLIYNTPLNEPPPTAGELEGEFMTPAEAAKQFGITPDAVRKAIADGRLRACKVGNTVWVFRARDAQRLWYNRESRAAMYTLRRAAAHLRRWARVRTDPDADEEDLLPRTRAAINFAWVQARMLGSTGHWKAFKQEHDRLAKILALLERWEREREALKQMREEQREMLEQFHQPPALQ